MEIRIDEVFENIDFTKERITSKDFDGCQFTSCNFAEVDWTDFSFADCKFENCNLSMVIVSNTRFQNISFVDCKLMGTDFSGCNDLLLSFSFTRCVLDYAFFHKKKLKGTMFKNCSIKEANFTETDLSNSVFLKCDLLRTIFDRTNLSQCDFTTAINYSINPEANIIKKARFSLGGLGGLLEKYDIEIE